MNYKKGTQTRGCMKSVMRYVSQLSKTLWDGQPLVSGIGCQPETAFDEFLSTKLLHRKDGGVMFYHMVQSFPKGADIDPRTAHEAARRLAEYFEGCEVLVCSHVDLEHIHSHCIINSVNFETGKKVHMADEQIQELRIRNDQICEELGLPKFHRDEQRHSRGMSNAEYYTADRGESWKFELMRVIDDCMRCAGNREEFLILLRSDGYDATWTDSRKNITYTTPDGRKCRDSKLHIEKYLKENMEAISIKCHDIKHFISSRMARAGIDNEELSELVRIYDTRIKTGNDTIDVLLSEQSLVCQRRNIRVTMLADACGLSFIGTTDICSLFGNLLENAVEAEEKIEDERKRVITVEIRPVADQIFLCVENYCAATPEMRQGLPVTSKGDAQRHGFGMKSIQAITEKYGGVLSCTLDQDIFRVSILFPAQ